MANTSTAETWTPEQTALPARLFDLMEGAEYHIACCDAPATDRLSALTELIEWCYDLRVTVQTGVPMADSDRFPQRVSDYQASRRA